MKPSVVISAYNEEGRLAECLKSVSTIAQEIIVVDNSSTDSTEKIAREFTDKVYTRKNNIMLNTNKNFGFSKAQSEWILNLDADERLTSELAEEILSLPEGGGVDGYYVPRKNIIFGKWIRHTGWYPDYQLRLFRKDKGKFEEKHVHELIKINGTTEHLENPLTHLNYDSISQFLEKMIKTYTVSEADSLSSSGYKFNFADIYLMPIKEFMSRYFARQGYMDGFHGLTISLLMAFYHFVVFLRLWEKEKFPEKDNSLAIYSEGGKQLKKESAYWYANEKINVEKNPIKKQLLKVIRKANS